MNKPTEFSAINVIVNALQRKVSLAKEAREKMAKLILQSDYSAVYEVRWLQGKVQGLHEGHYANLLLENLNTDSTPHALAATATFISYAQEFIDRWSPANSSSAYANAAAGEELLAMREVLKMAVELHNALKA